MRIRVERLAHAGDLPLPDRATAGAAGFDLRAALAEPLTLHPGRRLAVPTGLRLELPPGYEAQVRPRSGLARHHGVTVLNSPGTFDSDYRGELMVLLIHHGEHPLEIKHGDRIAQMIVARLDPDPDDVTFEEVDELAPTARGASGFGSTG